jgi:hypothetical protein
VERTYANRTATFLWAFAALWIGGVVALTWALARDGVPDGQSPAFVGGVVMLFWLAAAGLIAYVARQPVSTVRVRSDGSIEIVVRYPFRTVRAHLSPTDAGPAVLTEGEDIDGDPYFVCQLSVGYPFEMPVRLAEGDRTHCARVCAEFNALVAPGA